MSIFERLKNYANGVAILRDWVGSGEMPVAPDMAQARAAICLACPMNVDGIKLTETITEAIREQLELKNHLRLHVNDEDMLKTCSVCDCNNRLQVWCPDKLFSGHYTMADAVRYPKFCWKRKLIEASAGKQSRTGPKAE